MKGIEPSSLAWKAIALPLSYTRGTTIPGSIGCVGLHGWLDRLTRWGVQDSNLRRQSHQIYSLTPLTARETPLFDCCARWIALLGGRIRFGVLGRLSGALVAIASAALSNIQTHIRAGIQAKIGARIDPRSVGTDR